MFSFQTSSTIKNTTEKADDAKHDSASQTVAVQKSGQPLPLQIGERHPCPRISDDEHAGLKLVRQREAETEERSQGRQHPLVQAGQNVQQQRARQRRVAKHQL